MHLQAWRAGDGIHEVPITFTERESGTSNMSFAIARESAARVALLAIRRFLRPAPARVRPELPAGGHLVPVGGSR